MNVSFKMFMKIVLLGCVPMAIMACIPVIPYSICSSSLKYLWLILCIPTMFLAIKYCLYFMDNYSDYIDSDKIKSYKNKK